MEQKLIDTVLGGTIWTVAILIVGYSTWAWLVGAEWWPLWLLSPIGLLAYVVSLVREWGWFGAFTSVGMIVSGVVASISASLCFIRPVCGNKAILAVGGLMMLLVLIALDRRYMPKRDKRD
jgi:hypothetical protein